MTTCKTVNDSRDIPNTMTILLVAQSLPDDRPCSTVTQNASLTRLRDSTPRVRVDCYDLVKSVGLGFLGISLFVCQVSPPPAVRVPSFTTSTFRAPGDPKTPEVC